MVLGLYGYAGMPHFQTHPHHGLFKFACPAFAAASACGASLASRFPVRRCSLKRRVFLRFAQHDPVVKTLLKSGDWTSSDIVNPKLPLRTQETTVRT